MLQLMMNTFIKYFLLATLLSAFAVHAELYKGVDEEGNIVYSDKPFGDAKKFIPPSLTIVDALKIKSNKETDEQAAEEEKSAEFKYTDFDIVSPANGETLWNDPDPSVSLQLKPALNTAEGHTIWLLLDGRPLIRNSQELFLHIGRVDRGTHKLQAHVRDKAGKIVARTRETVIYVKQHSIIQNRSPR
jgi:hypothetical protein